MNQEQYLQPQKLEKCKEDLLHEPLRLYKVEDIEFQQEFNSEQKERATLLLQNLIASSRYNTFNSIERVFEKYKKINDPNNK